jgi:spermidine synthase
MASCIKTLSSMDAFPYVAGYYGIVSTFFQPWGFVLASKKYDPLALAVDEIEKRHKDRGVKTRYYTPRFHQAAFTLPEYILRSVETEAEIPQTPIPSCGRRSL